MEEDFDFIYIYDSDYHLVTKGSGDYFAGKTITIEGDGFIIRLTSDQSEEYYGFELESIKATMTTAAPTDEPQPATKAPATTAPADTSATASSAATFAPTSTVSASVSDTPKTNKISIKFKQKKVKVRVGKKKALKVKLTGAKKAKFKLKSKKMKKNIRIVKKKAKKVVIKGRKKGKAVVIAKAGKKKATCKISIVGKKKKVKNKSGKK